MRIFSIYVERQIGDVSIVWTKSYRNGMAG